MALFWLVVIGLIVWAVVGLLPAARSAGGNGRREGPGEILDRRFALGEIDAEQYRRARAELTAGRAGGR